MASCNLVFWITVALFPFVICSIKGPVDFIRNIGQNAVFKWNTTDSKTVLSVNWGLLGSNNRVETQLIYISIKNNVPVLSTNSNTVAVRYKGRVSWVGDLKAGRAWFKITNLTIQDTNQYAAAIREQGTDEAITHSTNLTVAELPSFSPSHPNKTYQIIEGRELSISCKANGTPTPEIRWVNVTDGSTKNQGRGTVVLHVNNIQRFQTGIYECQARNNPNEEWITKQTYVTVYYPPEINKTATLDVLGCIGREVRLFCKTSGSPKPSMKWKDLNNKEIFKTDGNVLSHLFKLKDSSAFGNYTCTVSNSLGNDSYVISLTEGACTTPTPKTDVPTGIIAGVVIAGILAIAGLIIALIFCYRRKSLDRDSFRSGAQQERTMQMSSLRNQEEQYASVQHQKHRGSSTEPIPQYAVVDKNKKKKQNPDGLIYADLDLDSMDNLERRPSSGGHPTLEAGSTVYADIAGVKKHHPEPQYGNLQAKDFSI